MASSVISCRWDWCPASFPSIDTLDTHVKHEHIWPMKPMRKAEIALMRRMDLQSLHSSPNTDSSFFSRGPIEGLSRFKTPPLAASPISTPETHRRAENEVFDTFTQLSSPIQTHSPKGLPASPAFEALMRHDSRPSAAVEMFERTNGRKANQRLCVPPHQHSPTRLSQSSGSSQEVVEQHLTQEVDVGSQPQPLLPSQPQIENELADAELRWPTDDEADVAATIGTQNSEQHVSKQPGSSPVRGQNFRCGSLNVPLDVHSPASQASHSQSQPIVLQTQAPYSSQATAWSQIQ
ncbi:hypothetical protein HD554DRAFT_76864 [Boletus coccyginus]|nr:hypothetical protein HD554DRAFT_76864 [Boletus coccyginus]